MNIRDVVLFLDIVTLSFSSVAFLLATVYMDALSAGAQSRFASFLFVAFPGDMSFSSGVILIFTWSFCLILLFCTYFTERYNCE